MHKCKQYNEASNLFFWIPVIVHLRGLNVYLDSPMVFALLGMDVPARVESCKQLVEKAQAAGCRIQIFDHIFQEIDGIVLRAAGWARSPDYSVDKANNVMRYFHDSDMDKQALAEYCENLEDMLADLDITIKQTGFDLTAADFQEDTGKLNEMIQQRYQEQRQTISEEKQRSIEIDVRSIIIVYRERRGQTVDSHPNIPGNHAYVKRYRC